MEEGQDRRPSRGPLAAEILLSAGLVFAPLALGSVQWWSLAVVFVLSAGAAIAVATARPRRPPWIVWAALGTAAWVGVQTLPLPPALLGILSPHAAELWALAAPEGAAPGWHPISLDPSATLREFGRLLGYAFALYAASRIATDGSASRRIARVIAATALAECALVLFHSAIATQRIYGIVQPTLVPSVIGSFGSTNHHAAWMTLALPMLVVVALRSPQRRWIWLLGAFATTIVIVATGSRSGLVGVAVVLPAMWVLARRYDDDAGALPRATVALLAVPCVAGLVVVIRNGRFARFTALFKSGGLLGEEKVEMWRDVPPLVRDHYLTGIGRGAFESVFPGYKHLADWMTFTHVECAPLQLVADLGLFVGAAVAAAWLLGLLQAARRGGSLLRSAAVVALVAVTLHDLSDFALDGSGAVGLTAAVLFGLATPAGDGVSRRFRPLALGVAGVGSALALIALWLGFQGDLRRDLDAVQARIKNHEPLDPPLADAIARHPAEPWFPFEAGVELVRRREPGPALRYLGRAQRLDPKAWRAHVATGEALFLAGRGAQAMLEFRLAYLASGWSDWVGFELAARRRLEFSDRPGRPEGNLADFAGNDPEILHHLADFLERNGRGAVAAEASRRLLALDPSISPPAARPTLPPQPNGSPPPVSLDEARVAAHRRLSRLALQAGRWDEVLAQTSALPSSDDEATVLRARALDHLDRPEEADALLDVAFTVAQKPEIGLLIAERALAQNRIEAARAALRALDRSGLSPAALGRYHGLSARAAEAAGKSRDAILEYAAAARTDPSEQNRLALGAAYERMGLLRDAYLAYREVVRSSPAPSADARAHLERLQKSLEGIMPSLVRAGPTTPAGSAAALPALPTSDEPEAMPAGAGEPGEAAEE